MGVKFHMITSRLGTVGVQKGRFGYPKIQLSSKVTKFAGSNCALFEIKHHF